MSDTAPTMNDKVAFRPFSGAHERSGRIVGRAISCPPRYDVEDSDTGERFQNLDLDLVRLE